MQLASVNEIVILTAIFFLFAVVDSADIARNFDLAIDSFTVHTPTAQQFHEHLGSDVDQAWR